MPSILLSCPSCQARFAHDESAASRKPFCPECGRVVEPSAETAAEAKSAEKLENLPSAAWDRLEVVVGRFEQAWRQGTATGAGGLPGGRAVAAAGAARRADSRRPGVSPPGRRGCAGGGVPGPVSGAGGRPRRALKLLRREFELRRESDPRLRTAGFAAEYPSYAEDLLAELAGTDPVGRRRAEPRGLKPFPCPYLTQPGPPPAIPESGALPPMRLRGAGRAGPRRHGRRLQGAAGAAEAAGRPEDDPGRRPCRRPGAGPLPHRGGGGGPACSTPTSCRSTRSASTTAGRSSRWSSWTAAAWRRSWPARRCRRARRPGWSRRWPGPCTPPTSAASSTAT